MAWYNSNWSRRVKVNVDYTKVSAVLSNYELLLTEANFPTEFWDNVESDGSDIVVTSDNGTSKLERDLIEFNSTTEKMVLRVGVPSLSSTVDTSLYLYYGNASSPETNSTSTYKSATKGYWPLHDYTLEEYPMDVLDRTSSEYHGWSQAGTFNANSSAKVGGGIDFPAVDGHILLASDDPDPPYGLTGNGTIDYAFSLSLWFYPDNAGDLEQIFGRAGNTTSLDYLLSHHAGKVRLRCGDIVSGGSIGRTCDNTLNTSAWNKIDVTYDASQADTGITFYLDGQLVTGKKINSGSYTAMGGQHAAFYTKFGHVNANDGLTFTIDEMIIRFEETSSDWIETSYNNENSPSTFYDVEAQESSFSASASSTIVPTGAADAQHVRFPSASNTIVPTGAADAQHVRFPSASNTIVPTGAADAQHVRFPSASNTIVPTGAADAQRVSFPSASNTIVPTGAADAQRVSFPSAFNTIVPTGAADAQHVRFPSAFNTITPLGTAIAEHILFEGVLNVSAFNTITITDTATVETIKALQGCEVKKMFNPALIRMLEQNLYTLKNQYGVPIVLCSQVQAETDYVSGLRDFQYTTTQINNAIVLPSNMSRTVIASVARISVNKKLAFGGEFLIGDRGFIIRGGDAPSVSSIRQDDWLIYRGRRYNILTVLDVAGKIGWMVIARSQPGTSLTFELTAHNAINVTGDTSLW